MRFIAAMAWREVRASWRSLILFFVCIALGVAANVSLRSFTRVFAGSVARDSRALLSADVRVESIEPWTPAAREILDRHGASSLVLAQTRILETQTMVRAEQGTDARPVMVEIRGLETTFPLRGAVRLSGGHAYSHGLLAGRGALVSPSLLERLQVKVGDRIVIGTAAFTIRGAVERLPGGALNFSPMPRVAVDYPEVEAAGLIGFGSRVRYHWLFNVPDGEERAFASRIGRDYRERRVSGSISSFHFVQNWLSGGLANVDGFFSLIGLAIVVLGGIGVASVTRVFVQQRVKTVAILKCLGGRNRRVIGAYLAQVLVLSFGGCLLGLLLAKGITVSAAGYLSTRLPLDVNPGLSALASAQGVAIGLLVALLFALPPLLEIRDVKPILVLRHGAGMRRRRFDPLKIGAQVLLAAAIAALAGWQAGTYRNATLFVAGIAATALVLQLASTVLMRGLAGLRRVPNFVLRQGIGSLHRPGNQTRVTLFTVGLGALFVIAVRLFQVNLQQEYTLDLGALSADMFMVDVMPDRRAEVAATIEQLGGTDVILLPVTHGRLVGLTRDPLNPNRVANNRVGGQFRLTHRLTLNANETVVKGAFWPATPSDKPEISVESGYAEWLRLGIGDVLVFDIAGRRVEARVTSIRTTERRIRSLSSLARSDFVFRPGPLEAMPHTYVGGAKGPSDPAARARLQNGFLAKYPGVTLVDALDDIEQIRRRVADVSTFVSILGAFVLACGVMILVGSVAMTKMHRLYEAAILKTLGAKRRVLASITVVEYAVLGMLAGAIGSAASIAVTWTMSHYGNRPLPWALQPGINLTGAVATAVLVVIVGVLATWDVLLKKPLGILREQ
jgi:putative ABC transport system permease protein